MDFATAFQRQRPALLFAEGLFLTCLIGLGDLLTGYEISMFIMYGVPIYAVAWFIGKKPGILISLICGLVWWYASVAKGQPYLNNWQQVWETFVRLVFFVFVAIGAASLKREQDAAVSRIALLEHARQLEREIIEISEREQRRIGRDLHDGLCQYQAALACAAASLNGDLMKKNLTEEAHRADELARRLREAVAQTRSLAHGLVPVHAEASGLIAALQELSASVSQLLEIDCQFCVSGTPPAFGEAAATHLYRITQEAINNATRHGKATEISVSLTADGNATVLRIADKGVGLGHATRSKPGMGLNIMRYRATLAGGELQVEEPTEGGTTISCLIRHDRGEENERAA